MVHLKIGIMLILLVFKCANFLNKCCGIVLVSCLCFIDAAVQLQALTLLNFVLRLMLGSLLKKFLKQ